MAEFLGGDYIYDTLSNDPEVSALTTAIYNSRRVPTDETAEETINFYTVSPYTGGLNYFEVNWSIDCRSNSESKALEIAVAVFESLNRLTYAVGDYTYFGVVDILPTVPPVEERDVYNAPVQILIRRR